MDPMGHIISTDSQYLPPPAAALRHSSAAAAPGAAGSSGPAPPAAGPAGDFATEKVGMWCPLDS